MQAKLTRIVKAREGRNADQRSTVTGVGMQSLLDAEVSRGADFGSALLFFTVKNVTRLPRLLKKGSKWGKSGG